MAVSLSPTQLKKPYTPKHEYYGLYNDRGEKFLDKINNGELFELMDGSSVTINKHSLGIKFLEEKKYSKLGGKKYLFNTNLGNFNLAAFKKTYEFGSNGGIGAGSKNTAIQESTQCVFNALAYQIKDGFIDENDITFEAISSSYQHCETTTELDDIYKFSQNTNWTQSFLTSSNIIYSHLDNNNFSHHRDSELINNLYESYKKCDLKFRSDKWNPSDVWLVNDSIINTKFSESIELLNDQVESMFKHNELVGISLKKLGKSPSITIKNLDKSKKKKYFYEDYKSTPKSKDVTILYHDGRICFRTFNFATGWSGEILGKTAAHGKIGMGAVNEILKKNNLGPISSSIKTKTLWETKEIMMTASMFILYNLYIEHISKEEFDIFIMDKNIDWKVSKMSGLQLLSKIKNSKPTTQNKIITEIISYASSELDDSSVYLKLS